MEVDGLSRITVFRIDPSYLESTNCAWCAVTIETFTHREIILSILHRLISEHR